MNRLTTLLCVFVTIFTTAFVSSCAGDLDDKGHVEDSSVSDDTAASADKPEPDHEPDCGEPYLCDDGTYDQDGDGYCPTSDCNDSNCAINLGAAEICDDLDNDCDERTDDIDNDLVETLGDVVDGYVDFDQDGWPSHKHRLMCVDNFSAMTGAGYSGCYTCREPIPLMYTADPDDHDTVPACLHAIDFGAAFLVTDTSIAATSCDSDTIFDPCDVLGDDGCIADVPPECIINEVTAPYGDCEPDVQYKASGHEDCPPEHE